MKEFEVGETVRINTPGESHHDHVGTVLGTSTFLFGDRIMVDLGDVHWQYQPKELMKETK